MDWFRAWAGLSTDIKYLAAMRTSGADGAQVLGVWVALMDHANQARPRGTIAAFDVDGYADFARIDPDLVRKIIDALGPNGRKMHDGRLLTQWKKRQGEPDQTRNERQKRWREGQKKAKEGAQGEGGDAESNGSNAVINNARNGSNAVINNAHNGRNAVTNNAHNACNGAEEKERSDFSSASKQACKNSTPSDTSGASRAGESGLSAGQVWALLDDHGAGVPYLRRLFATTHIRSWAGAGITEGQLLEAIARAEAARKRANDPSPINPGYLERFVTEVRSGLPARTDRRAGHVDVDAAAQQFLESR